MRGQTGTLVRLLLLWVVLELAAAAQVRSPTGGPLLVSWVRTATQPVVWVTQGVWQGLGDLARGTGSIRRLTSQNRQLRVEVERLRARLLLLQEDLAASREAARGMPQAAPVVDTGGTVGRCTYRNLAEGRMVVQVPVGHQARRDSPVIGAGGVVGRVVQASRSSCWVELITHPAAAVAVRSDRGEIEGLVAGNGTAELQVQYVRRRATVTRGMVLVTSGADGIHLPGIPVARVTTVRETAEPFLEISAEPTTGLGTLRAVLVLPPLPPGSPP